MELPYGGVVVKFVRRVEEPVVSIGPLNVDPIEDVEMGYRTEELDNDERILDDPVPTGIDLYKVLTEV